MILFIVFTGWAPTRKLKDVIWGLNSLFSVSIFQISGNTCCRLNVIAQSSTDINMS